MKEIWLVSRELEGWAAAGGIKDVVRDQAKTFPKVGWTCHVILPFYGFLKEKVWARGTKVWSGTSVHPYRNVDLEAWVVKEEGYTVHFLRSPGFERKTGLYTYTAEDEVLDPKHIRGQGFTDGFVVNLEFQWAVATYWSETSQIPRFVLGHDGHTGFLPAICRTNRHFESQFQSTVFALLIHNAGPGYRQEMPVSPAHSRLIGLPEKEIKGCILDHHYDPMVSASLHGRLATVSENYAYELTSGHNDHWSGPFGRWLRTTKTPLRGITNGIETEDKDPRTPQSAGIPYGFDPIRGAWNGKFLCREKLREWLVRYPSSTYGGLAHWEYPLYVMQGRLTAQKGVEALWELTFRALRENTRASFLIMAQGERSYEERMVRLAEKFSKTGRFFFINLFEDQLARLVFASGDFFLMPSEYEPCGLTDLKAQLMGTLPIVHRVGGLVKVKDGQTGFSYDKGRDGGFWGSFERSLRLYENHPQILAELRRQAFVSVLEESQWTRILEEKYIPWLTDPAPIPILWGPSPT